jgi:hypothetical protein
LERQDFATATVSWWQKRRADVVAIQKGMYRKGAEAASARCQNGAVVPMLRHGLPAPTASPPIASLRTRPPARAADAEASADDADSSLQARHLDALQRETQRLQTQD